MVTTIHTSTPLEEEGSLQKGQTNNKKKSSKPTLWQGLILAGLLATIAFFLGKQLPTVGGPVFAILLGLIIRNTMGMKPIFLPGLGFAARKILQWSIIALGFGLSFTQVMQTGLDSIWVTVITMIAAFLATAIVGRLLGVPDRLRTLIGAGTAICGGSAIAAIAPIIKSEDHETAFAVSTIFLFNVVAVMSFPVLGHLLSLSDVGFGLWAGTAINDTSSVVAAAYSYSTEAGDYATVVKLTRATFIIPVCLIYVVLEMRRQKRSGGGFSFRRLIPWFIVWFLAASAVRSTGMIPEDILSVLQFLAQFLMILALAAIGLSSNMKVMARAGWQPIVLGLCVWLVVCVTSLAVQMYSGVW